MWNGEPNTCQYHSRWGSSPSVVAAVVSSRRRARCRQLQPNNSGTNAPANHADGERNEIAMPNARPASSRPRVVTPVIAARHHSQSATASAAAAGTSLQACTVTTSVNSLTATRSAHNSDVPVGSHSRAVR